MLLTDSSRYGRFQTQLNNWVAFFPQAGICLSCFILTLCQYFFFLLIVLHWLHYSSNLSLHVKQAIIIFTFQNNSHPVFSDRETFWIVSLQEPNQIKKLLQCPPLRDDAGYGCQLDLAPLMTAVGSITFPEMEMRLASLSLLTRILLLTFLEERWRLATKIAAPAMFLSYFRKIILKKYKLELLFWQD